MLDGLALNQEKPAFLFEPKMQQLKYQQNHELSFKTLSFILLFQLTDGMQSGNQKRGQKKSKSKTIATIVHASICSRTVVTCSCWQKGHLKPVGLLPRFAGRDAVVVVVVVVVVVTGVDGFFVDEAILLPSTVLAGTYAGGTLLLVTAAAAEAEGGTAISLSNRVSGSTTVAVTTGMPGSKPVMDCPPFSLPPSPLTVMAGYYSILPRLLKYRRT
uniref:Uncharacterized protein n=1 Tax=Odontella aurita TaxID=265563 RepID=A0A7S4IT91_9STRA|mmetsp:Transcript_29885/g.88820  ORF Transcript_29885/g.88820 Transcript_29885/m.88820 type:complete len:215 (+) Transcript_29885:384-1028(+)